MSEQIYVAIGDIHGCSKSLNGLLKKLEEYPDLTYVFVGDYIDRGPDSCGVVDRLIEFEKREKCIFLRGNHEQMLLDARFNDDMEMWLSNGGEPTLMSYGLSFSNLDFPDDHMEFYQNTKMYYDTEEYFFVHAGLPPDKTIEESLDNVSRIGAFLWERSHLNAHDTAWEKVLVFGHTPRPHPIRKHNMIGIDTGCVYDTMEYGKLTAVILPEQKFIQQVSLDN